MQGQTLVRSVSASENPSPRKQTLHRHECPPEPTACSEMQRAAASVAAALLASASETRRHCISLSTEAHTASARGRAAATTPVPPRSNTATPACVLDSTAYPNAAAKSRSDSRGHPAPTKGQGRALPRHACESHGPHQASYAASAATPSAGTLSPKVADGKTSHDAEQSTAAATEAAHSVAVCTSENEAAPRNAAQKDERHTAAASPRKGSSNEREAAS
ncbi:uncharacterized protein LOC113146869 [Cyclospora cayetanensis]|uniref:Uncharacterized protein LOC113146869 n=1 Tax=Cyclospora cayetanensis TaxID=88456 RepID=A0A6P6RTY2_9EIME|nr:uncharacterized protein LOC113146869 [Cyclospora cayetanensis]